MQGTRGEQDKFLNGGAVVKRFRITGLDPPATLSGKTQLPMLLKQSWLLAADPLIGVVSLNPVTLIVRTDGDYCRQCRLNNSRFSANGWLLKCYGMVELLFLKIVFEY